MAVQWQVRDLRPLQNLAEAQQATQRECTCLRGVRTPLLESLPPIADSGPGMTTRRVLVPRRGVVEEAKDSAQVLGSEDGQLRSTSPRSKEQCWNQSWGWGGLRRVDRVGWGRHVPDVRGEGGDHANEHVRGCASASAHEHAYCERLASCLDGGQPLVVAGGGWVLKTTMRRRVRRTSLDQSPLC